jgi:succinate dehydrogenase / fumarate reductase, iron-sulfur subunit
MADITLKKIYIKVWRQNSAQGKGRFETYEIENISQGSSFLEMLDILNDKLISEGKDPIAFDHDCREGICGTCSFTSTAVHMAPTGTLPLASCTCANSAKANHYH